jgi:hypothetical protein
MRKITSTPNCVNDMAKTAYIAGKISGLDIEQARAKFEFAEQHLTEKGYTVINPMKLPHNHDKSWEAYMKECVAAMVYADVVYLLPCWHLSDGARIEKDIAHKLKINVKLFVES